MSIIQIPELKVSKEFTMLHQQNRENMVASNEWILSVLHALQESENMNDALLEIPQMASNIEFLSNCMEISASTSISDIKNTPDNFQQEVMDIKDELSDLQDRMQQLIMNTGVFRSKLKKICKSPPKF